MLTIAVSWACHTSGGARSDAVSASADFTLVLLRSTHGSSAASARAPRAIFRAHRAFLDDDVRAGRTPLVGQVIDGSPGPGVGELAGLLVFDSADPAAAARHFARDPAVAEGYFRAEFVPLETLSLVRDVPAAIAARSAAATSAESESNGAPSRPDLATYTICIAPDGPEAALAFRSAVVGRHVVLLGRLSAPIDNGLFAITTLTEPEALLTRVAAARDIDTSDWVVRTWISSPALVDVVSAALSSEEVAVEVVGPHAGVRD